MFFRMLQYSSTAKMLVFLFILCLSIRVNAGVSVDLINANVSISWIDFDSQHLLDGESRTLRTYNSRSLFVGVFGFGWCTILETRLDVSTPQSIIIKMCGAGDEYTFARSVSADFELENNFDNLDGNRYRLKKYWSGVNGIVYEKTDSYIFIDGNSGDQYVFSKSGYLIQTIFSDGFSIKYIRVGDVVERINLSDGSLYNIFYNENERISKIIDLAGVEIKYEYDKSGNLISATTGWGNNYHYEYDDLHNLTRIQYPDDTYILLTYDVELDWVKTVRGRDGCIEHFEFPGDEKAFYGNVTKKCGHKKTSLRTAQKLFSSDEKDGFSEMAMESNEKRINVLYRRSGIASSIFLTSGNYSLYTHLNPSGFPYQAVLNGVNWRYTRDKRCKRTGFAQSDIASVKYVFNGSCKLIAATTSKGHKYDLIYGSDGKVKSITSSQGLRVEYNDNKDSVSDVPKFFITQNSASSSVGTSAESLAEILFREMLDYLDPFGTNDIRPHNESYFFEFNDFSLNLWCYCMMPST